MAEDSPETGRIEVRISHAPAAYIYELFTPTVTINGERHLRPWGTHAFELPPGDYDVSISYPWLFVRDCGKSTVKVVLYPGTRKKIAYHAGMIRFLPGKISVE